MLDFKNLDLEAELKLAQKSAVTERAGDFKFVISFIEKKEGEEGVKKVKKKLKDLGVKVFEEDELNSLDFVPSESVDGLMLVAVYLFNWTEEDIIQLGRERLSMPDSFKFFIRFFSSPEKTFKSYAKAWQKFFSHGSLEIKKFDKKNQELIGVLKDFKTHPIRCVAFLGMLAKGLEMAIGKGGVRTKEIKCPFEGDDYHEFKFTW